MSRVLLVVALSLLGSTAAVRADDAPQPFRALAGGWGRYGVLTTKDGKDFLVPASVPTQDGKEYVEPGLAFFVKGKTGRLVISGTPSLVYWNPGPTAYDLVVPAGAKKGELAMVVPGRGVKREVRFEYTIEKDTLTISCKEKVPAGYWLGDYDISGRWIRPQKLFGYLK
jgi:hypothetical protein